MCSCLIVIAGRYNLIRMAAIGIHGVHKVIGFFCDLCGQECEGDKEELNALGQGQKHVMLDSV